MGSVLGSIAELKEVVRSANWGAAPDLFAAARMRSDSGESQS